MSANQYYIASLNHTLRHHEHIVWWGRMEREYTPVLGEYAGLYVFGYADDLNNGYSTIAVPRDIVECLTSPEPYYKPGHRFYDQRGPVVQNSRHNWQILLAARLKPSRPDVERVRPEVFRGKRRAIFTA